MKKLNLFLIGLLLIGQSILGPIGVATAGDVGDEFIPEEITDVTDQEIITGEDDSDEDLSNDDSPIESAGVAQVASNGGEFTLFNTETPIVIPNTLDSFELKINDETIETAKDRELGQGETVTGLYTFIADLENGAHVKDSWFTFDLPITILDFSGQFNGSKDATDDRPAFSYSLSGQTVTVKLDETVNPSLITSSMEFKLDFTAGFTFNNTSLEQELEIPKADGSSGTDKFALTFLPSTSGDEMNKENKGVMTQPNGERHITWEIWVNEAGKNLDKATLEDNPSQTPNKHTIVPDSVNVEQYTVGLNGVEGTGTSIVSNGDFNFVMNGKNAYKITYQTSVDVMNQNDNTYLSGPQDFRNTATLKDKDSNTLETDTSSESVTFGSALGKNLDETKINTNYKSHWEITYNYNLAPIPEAAAVITDTITGSHDIDKNSIAVYEVTVNESGTLQSESLITTGYTINPNNTDTEKSFQIKFNADDNGNVTKAYRITYEANYTDTDHPKFKLTDETLTNSVTSTTHTTAKTASHPMTENILRKSHTVDFDKKEIYWTITVKADNDEDITDLTITDTFNDATDSKGTHTLKGNVTVTNMTGHTIIPNPDLTKGFTITGGSVAAGQTATITYTTEFAIEANGSVHPDGYKNIAKAEWKDSNNKSYDLTKTSTYEPKESTANNGFKTGSFNYETQEFEWNIRVNVNKQNINNAVLYDELGEGHKIKDDSFSVNEYTFTDVNDDKKGDIGAALDASKYTLNPAADGKSFTLTFANDMDTANHKVYLVSYKTVDANTILGIESTDENIPGDVYSNAATFTTKIVADKEYTLPKENVTVKHANKLITKSTPARNSTNRTYTWTVRVNESHSSIGEVTLTDKPSDNLMLLPGTIQYQDVTQDSSYGDLTGGTWTDVDESDLEYTTDGGFKLKLGNLTKKSVNVRYTTLVLGQQGEGISNEAEITFENSNQTSENQKTEVEYENTLAFSASNADASAGKGNVNFKKVGYNPATGVKSPLGNVSFDLVKVVGGADYVLATATSNAAGEFSFEGIRYGTFKIVERNVPAGYDSLTGFGSFVVSAANDALLTGNEDVVVEIVNNKTMQPGEMCSVFTLTVKDEDGKTRENIKVKFVQNSNDVYTPTTTTDSNGKIIINQTDLPAGTYQIVEIDTNGDKIEDLGSVQVNYTSPDCVGEVQPAPACDFFIITVKEEGGTTVRPNVKITVVDANDSTNVIVTDELTNSEGEIELPNTTLPGTYEVYEGELYIGDIVVSYLTDCKDEVSATPSCPVFILTINDRNGNARDGVEVIVRDASENIVLNSTGTPTGLDGKVTMNDIIEPGTYTVYEVINGTERIINTFTVTDTCEAEVKPRPSGGGWIPPACDDFTITVKQNGTKVGTDVELTLKSGTTEIAKGKTNTNGEIVFDKNNLPEGSYTAYDADGNEVGTVTVTYEEGQCQTEIDLVLKSCEAFTITVKESGEVVNAGTSLTLKDASGNTVTTGTTDSNGKIVFDKADLPVGSYTATDADGKEVGTITVTYDEGKCQASIDLNPKVCETFELTVVDTPNTNVQLKDSNGKTIANGNTDKDGKVKFGSPVTAGEYDVYVDGEKVGSISVNGEDCEATITPEETVDPEDPNKPGEPSEPGTPGTPGDPNDPNNGGGELGDGGALTPGGDGSSKPGAGDKGELDASGNKLPQTGEELFRYMIALGSLFLAMGAYILFRQRRNVQA